LILLKLDFKKAFDLVSLPFLFHIMATIGVPDAIIDIVKVFFVDAEAIVLVNGGEIDTFSIQYGVRQGCPIVPYLFLFIGKALNLAAKKLLAQGALSGLLLPEHVGELLISQYVGDTNFLLPGNQPNFARLILLLDSYDLPQACS
jgi:hypothetical protein